MRPPTLVSTHRFSRETLPEQPPQLWSREMESAVALRHDVEQLASVFSGHPKVSAFLMTTVQAGTTARYFQAFVDFKGKLEELDVDWLSLDAEQKDWILAERILEMQEDE